MAYRSPYYIFMDYSVMDVLKPQDVPRTVIFIELLPSTWISRCVNYVIVSRLRELTR